MADYAGEHGLMARRFRIAHVARCLILAASFGATCAADAALPRPDPDGLLIAVYKDLAASRLQDAMAKANALVKAYPNFQLGHLIRGDLLLMQTRKVERLGAVDGAPPDALDNLREEAAARLKALYERPNPDAVPRAVLQLRRDQKNVLVVDASRSRLYVYENRGGELHFARDFYISQGKLGVDKRKEGDGKTPLGVYYITSRLAGARLPDFYGTGALPISYPNEWDRLHGRDGYGIWLHGTPASNYSRPPLSSDGCVVLTNPDLNQLYASVEVGKTPVVISRQMQFVSRKQLATERDAFAAVIEKWRGDVESLDAQRLRGNYSSSFRSDHGEDADAWLSRFGQDLLRRPGAVKLTVRDMSLFLYPGQDNLMVATFTQDAAIGKFRRSTRRRQYWAREGASWKIVSESAWQS
ncbi:L,D-transpeptidase family protein [Noviherbaspirillum pedocola]|uniref:L,D-transpeptidase family protein n=1 Tax=Noviherbaspirillum pedocola TaxID=2801341 RepID=A0A934SSD8_9BURK|nr:L,D-transpeptidase family protein [Noviherbaspirillum pedocola]MBK4735720.1 L,D-transpeptidase family protein [Noviherbaspirillum pedocola]